MADGRWAEAVPFPCVRRRLPTFDANRSNSWGDACVWGYAATKFLKGCVLNLKIVAILLAGVVLPVAVSAQTQDDAAVSRRLDEVVSSYTHDNAFMGTVLVAEGDKILLNKGYGQAVVEWNVPNVPEARFRLGSLTKQFTATLVLALQQDGKLDIHDPVSKYVPDAPKTWEKITVADLLGHTSGIPNFTNDKEFGAWRMTAHTHEEELAFFRNKPLDFEPGTKFDYSNSNFEVLGVIIEKVSGKTYEEMLHERIFGPLGMKNTGLDHDDLVLPKRAEGYSPGPNGLVVARSESMTVPWAAGSLYSTTGDLLLWARGLFGHKVLNDASLKLMTTPGKGSYGLGVFVSTTDNLQTVEHGGGIEGFNTYLLYVPERQIAVVALSNVNGNGPDSMSPKLRDVVLGKKVTLASERKIEPISQAELQKFVGSYQLSQHLVLNIAVTKDGLTVQPPSQPPFALFYAGMQDGHPRFFAKAFEMDLEFVPDANGKVDTMILHQGPATMTGKRQ